MFIFKKIFFASIQYLLSSSSWFSPPPLNCLILLTNPFDGFSSGLMLPTIPQNPKNSLAKVFHFPLLKLYQNLNFFKLKKGTPHRGLTPPIVGPPPPINQSQLPQKKDSIFCMCNSLLCSFLLVFNIFISSSNPSNPFISILPNTNSLSSQFFQILIPFHPNSSKY